MNGTYVGILDSVTKNKPWRGIVLIDGVLKPATSADRVDSWRRGFRPGEKIEVGGVNITPTELMGLLIERRWNASWPKQRPAVMSCGDGTFG